MIKKISKRILFFLFRNDTNSKHCQMPCDRRHFSSWISRRAQVNRMESQFKLKFSCFAFAVVFFLFFARLLLVVVARFMNVFFFSSTSHLIVFFTQHFYFQAKRASKFWIKFSTFCASEKEIRRKKKFFSTSGKPSSVRSEN